MNTKKCFIVGVTLLACLFGLQTTLWGQEPNDVNDVVELKMTIAKLEKQIEQQEKKIKRLREEMQVEREELQSEKGKNQRLIKICRQAGINYEDRENQMEADYEVCKTPIEPNVLSDSMKTLGFTQLKVGELGWVDRLKITQIIDINNAIAEIKLYKSDGSIAIRSKGSGSNTFIEVSPYTSVSGLQIGGVPVDETVWIKGVQTKGWADDTSQIVNRHFVITGTKTYDTAIGSHMTLYVIEPVILSPKRLKQETLHYKDLMGQRSQTGSQKKKRK